MRAEGRVPVPRAVTRLFRPPPADAVRVYRCPRRPNAPSCTPQPPGIGECRLNGLKAWTQAPGSAPAALHVSN
jgi:hypothetical protein